MMQQSKIQDPTIKEEIVSGFVSGGNTSQDETLIKDSELTAFKNILLELDGVSPRPGTEDFSSSAGTTIQGVISYYRATGEREIVGCVDGKLKKYNPTTNSWSAIGSTNYSTTADMNFVQARDLILTFNGVNNLTTYNGTSITTYAQINTPGKPVVTKVGTGGAVTYSYRLSAYNNSGETLATASTTVTSATSSLSVSNYNNLAWSAVSGATGYNIYGRKSGGIGETYITSTKELFFKDQGADEPSATIIPPDYNTTSGIKCSMACFAISRIFAAGDPDNPSRVYWSGQGTQIANFASAPSAGGYADVFKNDGAIIRSIVPFQGGVIIFKDNAIYKLTFEIVIINDTEVSAPRLEEITRSFGGISFRSTKAVENDIVFAAKKDGRLAFYSLGNQENYAGSVLRTNELSIKVAEKMEDVNTAKLPEAAALYHNSIYMCAVAKAGSTDNNRIWLLDTRFGAWVYWEGFKPKQFLTYENSDGVVIPLFANEDEPKLVEMFKNNRNDNGNSIDVEFSTKAYNQKVFHKYKRYYNPTFQFKEVNRSGEINGEIYVDGAILEGEFSVNQQVGGGAGVGAYLVGFHLPGEAPAGVESTEGISSDIVTEASYIGEGRSIKYRFRTNTLNLYYKFLSLSHGFEMLPEMPLNQNYRSYLNY